MKNFDLVIFDCDGVLVDSKEANYRYYNDILVKLGLGSINKDELDYVHTHTAEQSILYLFRNNKELYNNALELIKKLDYLDYLPFLKIEPDVVEILKDIRPPVLTAIFTNRTTTMPKLVKMFGFDRLFDSIMTALDVDFPKPHPQGILKIIDKLGIEHKKTVFVGDSILDEQAARDAGISFIAYKNEKLEAMFHVKHFYEIKKIVLSKNSP
ncbi:MAG: HAD family hydrolase [Dissulfurimicrobium sp.]|uniref:HAD family hydrolase n=1 Tax=Dissulfurimicrobium TaxID=1769732 RepID=UPI001EDA8887|nr:HAD family hydrolase [Dissulfurimicrobium hydrothermale]UKL14068.1 HAD family hydrolase [Dissulfurimicrobium hydrothermale]